MAKPSPDRRHGRRALAAAVLAGALGVAGAGLARSDDGPPPGRTDMVQNMPADLAARFGVLRATADAGDALPALAAGMVAGGPTPSLGANPALARHALRRPDGLEVYVVPARGWICIADNAGAGTCNHSAEAFAGRVVGTARLDAGTARVWGLVPDGPREVALLHARGPATTTPVEGNAYAADTNADVAAVRWSDAGGEHTVPVVVPEP